MPKQFTITHHNKLIRDRVVPRIEASGEKCSTRTLDSEAEFLTALATKLREEADEAAKALNVFCSNLAFNLYQDGDHVLEELADLSALIDEAQAAIGKSSLDLNAAKCEKLRTHGGFQHRVFLERTWKEEA